MGSHARAPRAASGRAAIAVTLVAVTAAVLVGVGVAHQTAPASASAAEPVPVVVPVVAPTSSAAPARPPAPTSETVQPTSSPQATSEETTEPSSAETTTTAPATTRTMQRSVPARTAPSTSEPLVHGTPCTATAQACVDLAGRKAWLLENGAVVRGPVKVMTGDRDDPTPKGTFQVQWKAEQYTSREYLVEMPYSVFFAEGGIAFHEGRQDTYSAGCVKLVHEDAVAFFNALQVGEEVQIR